MELRTLIKRIRFWGHRRYAISLFGGIIRCWIQMADAVLRWALLGRRSVWGSIRMRALLGYRENGDLSAFGAANAGTPKARNTYFCVFREFLSPTFPPNLL